MTRLGLTLVALVLTATVARADVVTLAWDANPPAGLAGYRVGYGTTSGTYTTIIDVGNVTTTALTLTTGVQYYLAVLAYNTTGDVSPYSIELAELVGAQPPPPVPVPWTASDIGAPTLPGSTTFTAGVFTVNGAGVDIWGTSDQFQFVSQPLTGDGEIIAKVESLGPPTHPYAKAGVMIREDLSPGAPNALMYVSAGQGLLFSQRLTRGGATTSVTVAGVAPYWVRLTRVGTVVTAARSPNGTTWTPLGTAMTIPMAASAQIGLAVVSLVPATATTGVFSNVSVRAIIRPPAPASTFRVVR